MWPFKKEKGEVQIITASVPKQKITLNARVDEYYVTSAYGNGYFVPCRL